jgi:hypothetical protein
MIKIKVKTLFDITATGVTGHFKSARLPYTAESWSRARNQQRNWETLAQIINLRTQIMSVTDSGLVDNTWTFEFESESNVWDNGSDPVGVLKQDCAGVPMLLELDNNPDIEATLVTEGPRQNIWFDLVPINNILENKDG